jgi:hypothetical protein
LYLFSRQLSYKVAKANMPVAAQPVLKPGSVYRTHDLLRWGKNAPRLADRLVREGRLRRLRQGLYEAPRPTLFGDAPARDADLVRAFLGTDDFVFSGSEVWNALGLGATAVRVLPLVYNRKRSGIYGFGGRRFEFRRVAYPSGTPPVEWFAIDLLRHSNMAGVDPAEVLDAMVVAVDTGRLQGGLLLTMAKQFGRAGTVRAVQDVLGKAGCVP